MNNIKRILALLLVTVMALSFTACHKKDEIAVTVGDVKFTSAYYMCALINADLEAKDLIYEELSAEEQLEEIDYYSQKIDDKDYVEWVEDTAIEHLKGIAAYKIICKENELELNEEAIESAEYYANFYWASGYGEYFEPNGVSSATYTQYIKDTYYSELYFEHLYGKDGEKAIADADVATKIYDNFIIANMLEATYSSDTTDEEKTETKTKFEGYLNDLKDGKKSFEEIYKEYNQVSEEEDAETDTNEEKSAPKDAYANILGADDTSYESEYYKDVKAMTVGEMKLIELEDDGGLLLVIKKDIKADEYYKEVLDMNARHMIADEEFEEDMEEYIKTFEPEIDKYAVGQFKVKKIKEPEYSY